MTFKRLQHLFLLLLLSDFTLATLTVNCYIAARNMASSGKVEKLQQDVDELTDVMRTNIHKVTERDEKISNLQDRSEMLQSEAQRFEKVGKKIKRKMWWKNFKMWLILIAVILVIIAAIVIWVVTTQVSSSSNKAATTSAPSISTKSN